MSIVINCMDMPEKCKWCLFYDARDSECFIFKAKVPDDCNARIPSCPLGDANRKTLIRKFRDLRKRYDALYSDYCDLVDENERFAEMLKGGDPTE